jgi:D-arabinose 1-dehydrogenase-like Zn-dependent alcohol dehydrogenase
MGTHQITHRNPQFHRKTTAIAAPPQYRNPPIYIGGCIAVVYAVAAGGGHCGDSSSTSPISELQPHLERLEANPGSIVLLAIEKPQVCHFARCVTCAERVASWSAIPKCSAIWFFRGTGSGDVQGLGGLGHLGVQYAAQMGFKTVGIARGQDKEALARQLGAHHYVDSQAQDPAAELQKLGGAKAILTTVTDANAMATMQGGLGLNGTLMIVGVSDSIQVSPALMIFGRRAVKGWYSGTARDSEDTLKFSALTGVKSMNEVYPLDRVAEAYDRMISGKARFRVVLKMEQ